MTALPELFPHLKDIIPQKIEGARPQGKLHQTSVAIPHPSQFEFAFAPVRDNVIHMQAKHQQAALTRPSFLTPLPAVQPGGTASRMVDT
jgi:hypothetical protein